jgi:hypothetical protein
MGREVDKIGEKIKKILIMFVGSPMNITAMW